MSFRCKVALHAEGEIWEARMGASLFVREEKTERRRPLASSTQTVTVLTRDYCARAR